MTSVTAPPALQQTSLGNHLAADRTALLRGEIFVLFRPSFAPCVEARNKRSE